MLRYRPRKPKFYNKVKTGFDWNKYNQTHYDKETPPPKRVMGYRFNILYPDLIDMRKTPQVSTLDGGVGGIMVSVLSTTKRPPRLLVRLSCVSLRDHRMRISLSRLRIKSGTMTEGVALRQPLRGECCSCTSTSNVIDIDDDDDDLGISWISVSIFMLFSVVNNPAERPLPRGFWQ